MARKAAGPRIPTQKQQAKAKQRADRLAAKNEKSFATAVLNSKESILETDFVFIKDTLAAHPQWISPLAGLIRSGSLNGLLREVGRADRDLNPGQKWKGRATKWGQLPLDMVVLMLRESGVELSPAVSENEEFVRMLFYVQFWTTRSVPLPTGSQIRYVRTLTSIARQRLQQLGRNWLAKKNAVQAISVEHKSEHELWTIDGDELVFYGFAVDGNGQITSDVGADHNLRKKLPVLPEGHSWNLTDEYGPDCIIHDGSTGSIFSFRCYDLFMAAYPQLPDPEKKWVVDLQTDDSSAAGSSSTTAS